MQKIADIRLDTVTLCTPRLKSRKKFSTTEEATTFFSGNVYETVVKITGETELLENSMKKEEENQEKNGNFNPGDEFL